MQGSKGGGIIVFIQKDALLAGKIGIREDELELFCKASKVLITVLFYHAVAICA